MELFLELNLPSERNRPANVNTMPVAAIHVTFSFNTITDVNTVITGTI